MTRDQKKALPVRLNNLELDTPADDFQIIKFEFLKGSDKVVRYLQIDTLFEIIAEYEETHLIRDAKTGVFHVPYYNRVD